MRLEAPKCLYDIHQACRLVTPFITAKTFDDYASDALLRSAVERQLTIIGKALNRLMRLDSEVGCSITAARQIIAFRNILVHGYDIVRNEVVWGILENDLAALTCDVDALLGRGRAEQAGQADQ
jgi:uncharacterized protein with HEPN domain